MPTLLVHALLYLIIALAFTPFAALVLSGLTLAAGKLSPDFEISGPEDWTFRQFYLRYLAIAAVFAFVAVPLLPLAGCLGVLLGMAAMIGVYKRVFDAGWLQALVLGGMGGAVALVLFVFLVVPILRAFGL